MKRTKSFFLILIMASLLAAEANAQHVAQFALWKPKDGQQQAFENGYQQHLGWHRTHGDTWSWYGWFFTAGPRDGQFIDATFGHAWSDFDHPTDPTSDGADNALHVYPFAELIAVFKAVRIPALTTAQPADLQAKYLRLVTLGVTDMAAAQKLLRKYQVKYSAAQTSAQPPAGTTRGPVFVTYKPMDGADINQLIVLIPYNTVAELAHTDTLQEDLAALQEGREIIHTVSSETLAFQQHMSLLPGGPKY